MPHLLILAENAVRYAELLQQRSLPNLTIQADENRQPPAEAIAGADIVLGDPDRVAGILAQARRLVWVQSTFAGIDALCRPGLRTDYCLTGVKGVFGPLMSEYVFAYILAWERHLLETRRNQAQKRWCEIPYRRLKGLTLGICGTGDIGRHVAVTGRHFGMRTVGFRQTRDALPGFEEIYPRNRLHDFLRISDYVVVALPATSGTKGLIDDAALYAMKPEGVLINIGRGNVIVEKDLVRALGQQRIRGAVLDVFETEPLPPGSPLWEMPNVWITPHNSGKSFPEDITDIFCSNYMRFVRGETLKYVVDFASGY